MPEPTVSRSPERGDVVTRIAAQSAVRRASGYTEEVRRLLDAAVEVMSRQGGNGRARVADIVAASGLSNDAFYRHFRSKDALVAALVEDGSQRLASYVAHQMGKAGTPQEQVRRWVQGILSQAYGETAAITLAVLGNGRRSGWGGAPAEHDPAAPLAELLQGPLRQLGTPDAALRSILLAHAVLGVMEDHLWERSQPGDVEVDGIVACCLAAAGGAGAVGEAPSEPGVP